MEGVGRCPTPRQGEVRPAPPARPADVPDRDAPGDAQEIQEVHEIQERPCGATGEPPTKPPSFQTSKPPLCVGARKGRGGERPAPGGICCGLSEIRRVACLSPRRGVPFSVLRSLFSTARRRRAVRRSRRGRRRRRRRSRRRRRRCGRRSRAGSGSRRRGRW